MEFIIFYLFFYLFLLLLLYLILKDPSFIVITIILSFVRSMSMMRIDDFNELHYFYTFHSKINFPWGSGHKKTPFYTSLPTSAAYRIL